MEYSISWVLLMNLSCTKLCPSAACPMVCCNDNINQNADTFQVKCLAGKSVFSWESGSIPCIDIWRGRTK